MHVISRCAQQSRHKFSIVKCFSGTGVVLPFLSQDHLKDSLAETVHTVPKASIYFTKKNGRRKVDRQTVGSRLMLVREKKLAKKILYTL